MATRRHTPEQTTFLQRFRRHEARKLRVYSVRVHSARCQIAEQRRLYRRPGLGRGSLRSEIAGSAYCGRVVTDPINGLTGRGVTIKSGRRGAVWAFEQ